MSKTWRIFISVVALCINQMCFAEPPAGAAAAAAAPTIPEMINLDEIARQLKVSEFKGRKFTRKIKVAVLDNGFSGYEQELGKGLPQNTTYHKGKASDADRNETESFH